MPRRVGLLVHSSILSGLSDGSPVVFVDKLHESSATTTSSRTLIPATREPACRLDGDAPECSGPGSEIDITPQLDRAILRKTAGVCWTR
jgi:hypothetical protein